MKKLLPITLLTILLINVVNAQVYTEKQTRHRFAQLTLGVDYQVSSEGKTTFLTSDGQLQNLKIPTSGKTRILIGGTHFWGHADFQISIPITGKTISESNQEVFLTNGVETSFKYFPWRIEHKKVRPYVGSAITPYFYAQNNANFSYKKGPGKSHITLPLLMGATFNSKSHLIELGFTWNYANRLNYYVARDEEVTIKTPPFFAAISYRYMLDTTLGAEKDWESGKTQRITQKLRDAGRLNGVFFGVGMSSAWWLGESSYNTSNYPFVAKKGTSLMPDFALGYYLHKQDVNISFNYRGYKNATNTYGVGQLLSRKSVGLELTKYLGSYHGFDPFVGPILSTENLSYRENVEGNWTKDVSQNKLTYGLTFGWDIRPNRIQSFLLRTNLRWFPQLGLDMGQSQIITFRNIEFNFIQLVVFPNRIFGK